jgi:hypothetical protein
VRLGHRLATVANSDRNCRFAIVGGIIVSSPDACRPERVAGLTHRLSMVSLSSCVDACSGGAGAT